MTDAPLVPEGKRANDIVASLAVTMDGYICRPDGAVDYLDKYPIEEFDFDAWADRIGALVMGRTSYEQAVGWGWMWGDRPTLVLTNATHLAAPDGANIAFSAEPTVAAIASFAKRTPGRLWVFGGGSVVTEALVGGVVDTLDITIVPEAIGEGIPLFTSPFEGHLRVLETFAFSNGAVRLVYDASGYNAEA